MKCKNNGLYYRNRHACFLLQYHLVVVTKYRKPVIKGDIKTRLMDITEMVLKRQWELEIIAVNTDIDHIHILFEAPPQIQLSKLINNYKTVSSRLIRKEFKSELEHYYWKPCFWSDSYFICTVSDKNEKTIKNYIELQDKH